MEKAELIQDKQMPKMKVFIIDDSKNYYIENKAEYIELIKEIASSLFEDAKNKNVLLEYNVFIAGKDKAWNVIDNVDSLIELFEGVYSSEYFEELDFNIVINELNKMLSVETMKETIGVPFILYLLADGSGDNCFRAISLINRNRYYQWATKICIALGNNSKVEEQFELVGNREAVFNCQIQDIPIEHFRLNYIHPYDDMPLDDEYFEYIKEEEKIREELKTLVDNDKKDYVKLRFKKDDVIVRPFEKATICRCQVEPCMPEKALEVLFSISVEIKNGITKVIMNSLQETELLVKRKLNEGESLSMSKDESGAILKVIGTCSILFEDEYVIFQNTSEKEIIVESLLKGKFCFPLLSGDEVYRADAKGNSVQLLFSCNIENSDNRGFEKVEPIFTWDDDGWD